MAAPIAGVIWRAVRPSELAYRHTSQHLRVASGPAVLTLCESSVARRRSDGVEPDATGAT